MKAVAVERLNFTPSKPQRAWAAYGAARKLWNCRDEEILIEGPAGTGKTRSILEKMFFCAMKYPGMRGLLVRKTRESMTESVLVTFEEKVVPEDSPILQGSQRKLRQAYIFPNGSRIVVGGMDKATKIMSTEWDMIGTFETTELTEDDFESLTTRLRNHVMPYQQIIADCNPGHKKHWLNLRPRRTGMTRLLSRHEDNPNFYDHKRKTWTDEGRKYIAKLDRLSGVRKLRLRFGVWASAEGMVYEGYDERVHVVPRFQIPPTWRRVRAIDFGFTQPFVCQWWAIDGDGRMYLYREIYLSHRLVQDHVEHINRLSAGETIEATVADHDAEGRATADRYDLNSYPAYKAIEPGLEAVKARLRPVMDGSGEERPRLVFLRDSLVEMDEGLNENSEPLCTVDEIDGYTYKRGADGRLKKDEPVDYNNHGMDAMRYAVAYVDDLQSMVLKVTAEEPVVVQR